MKIPVVHLTRKSIVSRNQTDTRAFPLTEKDMPKHDGTPESVAKIIEFLNVERSARYRFTGASTFCNIYAYDFVCLMGKFLPRVFWTTKAIAEGNFKAQYGVTVSELNANALYDWFPKFGAQFGWRPVENKTEAQALANEGKCVILVAANKNRSRSGHIVAIVPETDKHKAVKASGIVVIPLQSQAGLRNLSYFAAKWWNNHEPIRIYVAE